MNKWKVFSWLLLAGIMLCPASASSAEKEEASAEPKPPVVCDMDTWVVSAPPGFSKKAETGATSCSWERKQQETVPFQGNDITVNIRKFITCGPVKGELLGDCTKCNLAMNKTAVTAGSDYGFRTGRWLCWGQGCQAKDSADSIGERIHYYKILKTDFETGDLYNMLCRYHNQVSLPFSREKYLPEVHAALLKYLRAKYKVEDGPDLPTYLQMLTTLKPKDKNQADAEE